MKFELLPILIIAEVDSSYAHYLVVCLGGNDYGPERVNVLSVVFIPEHRNSRNYFNTGSETVSGRSRHFAPC